MEGVEEAEIWLRELPALVAALEREWEIETGNPYDDASSSWVAPATRSDGTPAVLKISWPHERGEPKLMLSNSGRARGPCSNRPPTGRVGRC
jgi:streptomycin 6-kinase